MAMNRVVVNVVDVGQGQCTFVEIYADAGAVPAYTLLFDCGSNKQSAQTGNNLKYIADQVKKMPTWAFDCVFFSHSDSDHINLMFDLLQEFPFGRDPQVRRVWYGGARSKYSKGKRQFNILNYLDTRYCPTNEIKGFTGDSTNYNGANAYAGELWSTPDGSVAVRLIAGNVLSNNPVWNVNTPLSPTTDPEALNRVSLVAALYFAGGCYVICGDATNQTMGAVTNLFQGGTTVFNRNFMTTLPHHGSRRTGLAVASAAKASDNAVNVVSTFSTIMDSKSLTASAYQKHKHPSLELMCFFPAGEQLPLAVDPRLAGADSHWMVAWNESIRGLDNPTTAGTNKRKSAGTSVKQGYCTIQTPSNTYATNYSQGYAAFRAEIARITINRSPVPAAGGVAAPPINPFACWVFTTRFLGGGTTLEGRANLASAPFTQAGTPMTTAPAMAPAPPRRDVRPPASRPRRFSRKPRAPR